MKIFALIICGCLLSASGYGQPLQPLWSDLREGDGSVLALGAGKNPVGVEVILAGGYCRTDDSRQDLRVVCFDAGSGRVLWEARENRSLPNMMVDPLIVVDPAGDVLVGWEDAAVRSGPQRALCKLQGRDGSKIWEWKAQSNHDGAGLMGLPVPDQKGRIWVSGIQSTGPFEYRRFMALLDGKDGTTRWEKPLNLARDAHDRPAGIHPLKDDDALVVTPPPNSEKRLPWIVARISADDGTPRWQHDILRDNDRNLQSLQWVVDEGHGQIVVCWNSVVAGKMHFDVIAYDFITGVERWHTHDGLPAEFQSLRMMTLGAEGKPVLWGSHSSQHTHVNWGRWRHEEGFWSPEVWGHEMEQPIWITLSAADGTVREHGTLGNPNERINAALHRQGANGPDVLILRDSTQKEQVEPWRAAWIDETKGVPFLDETKPAPSGPGATLRFPRRAILTPGGHIVIAGDPAKEKRVWQVTVW